MSTARTLEYSKNIKIIKYSDLGEGMMKNVLSGAVCIVIKKADSKVDPTD